MFCFAFKTNKCFQFKCKLTHPSTIATLFTEPILERSSVIEGDVLLYKQRKHRNRAIPLMSGPTRVADRITFKEWLREVSKLRRGIFCVFICIDMFVYIDDVLHCNQLIQVYT
ncbi:unnamed protein product [Anisakis simplex]|uniref:Menorin-like domain-containing protein n=1 Tax=Anisakis simplex TaxID=6269 RepID=A0A3P6NVM1_ANISI|nr:unnamed protein product [Anisakis simplex]